MNTNRFIERMGLVATLSLMAWLPVLPTHAADQRLATSSSSAPAQELNVASGAAEDTLKACLARIPQDSSAGQRMMAEQGCNRDEAMREFIDAVPSR